MRYVSQSTVPGHGLFLTVEVRRWWWPWSWRRVEYFKTNSVYRSSGWVDGNGSSVGFQRGEDLDRLLHEASVRERIESAREAELAALLADDKPAEKFRALSPVVGLPSYGYDPLERDMDRIRAKRRA